MIMSRRTYSTGRRSNGGMSDEKKQSIISIKSRHMGHGTRGSSIRFEDEVLSSQKNYQHEPNFNDKMPKTDSSSAII